MPLLLFQPRNGVASDSVANLRCLSFDKLRLFLSLWVFAQVEHRTRGALGAPRGAGIATMQNQPVVCISDKLIRNDFDELLFDLQDILAGCKSSSVRYSKNMGIDRHGGFTKRRI